MGIYSQQVLPWLCDLTMRWPRIENLRHELLAEVGGEILEIGFGTGLNLAHYPRHVRKITVVEPNPGMQRRAKRRMAQSAIEVDLRLAGGERLPFDAGAFDCVVSTFTLCSIDEVGQAIGEFHRVLKPGGRFLFLEHGLSPDPQVQKWQRRLNWLQQPLAGNCRLDRDIRRLVSSAPFANIAASEFYLEHAPRAYGYLYRGAAMK